MLDGERRLGLRVLYITLNYPCDSFPYAGIFIHRHALKLKARRCLVDVLNPLPWIPPLLRHRYRHYARIPDYEVRDGIEIWHPRFLLLPGVLFADLEGVSFWSGSRRLAENLCRARKYDVVHSHWEATGGVLGLYLQRRFGLPHVCTVRGRSTLDLQRRPGPDRLLRRRVLKQSTRVLAVSRELAGFLREEKVRSDVDVLYNGVDLSVVRPPVRSANSERKNSRVVFAFVGSLVREKGVVDLMTAFKSVAASRPDAHLLVAGDGPLRNELTHMAMAWRDRVSVDGLVAPEKIGEVYGKADVLVLPSFGEGLSNVAAEGAAYGVPVIAYDVRGLSEAVLHQETGLLVSPSTAAALASAMLYLASSPRERSRLGRAALEHARRNFDMDGSVQRLFGIYSSLATRRNG